MLKRFDPETYVKPPIGRKTDNRFMDSLKLQGDCVVYQKQGARRPNGKRQINIMGETRLLQNFAIEFFTGERLGKGYHYEMICGNDRCTTLAHIKVIPLADVKKMAPGYIGKKNP